MDFLRIFNAREMRHIRENARRAWAKLRVYVLFKASIKGFSSGQDVKSVHAIFCLIEWWRSFTAHQKLVRQTQEVMHNAKVPEDERDFRAQQILENPEAEWKDLSAEQQAQADQEWAAGVANCMRNTAVDNEKRRKEEAQKLVKDSIKSRSLLAFPKPSDLEEVVKKDFCSFNPDFKKQEAKKQENRQKRASFGKDKRPTKQAKLTVSASSAGSSSMHASQSAIVSHAMSLTSDSEDSDDEIDMSIIRKTIRRDCAERAMRESIDSSDSSDSE